MLYYCIEKQNFLSDDGERMNEELENLKKQYTEMVTRAETMDDCAAVTVR